MGTSRQGRPGSGSNTPRRLGDLAGEVAGQVGDLRSARRNTTHKPPTTPRAAGHPTRHATPEELREKAARLLPHSPSGKSSAAPQSCSRCGGAGWVKVAEIGPETNQRTVMAECGCQAEAHALARWERALAASDLSPLLRSLDFAGYDATYNPQALSLMADWTKGLVCAREGHLPMPSPWVLLYGGMGTGKTHLLAAAFNVLLGAGRYPLYAVVRGMRERVLAWPGGWPAWDTPLEPEQHRDQLELFNPALGGGVQQVFRTSVLEWNAEHGVLLMPVGSELLTTPAALSTAQTALTVAQSQIAYLHTQLAEAQTALANAQAQAQAAAAAAATRAAQAGDELTRAAHTRSLRRSPRRWRLRLVGSRDSRGAQSRALTML